jgi:hypothetical protein
VSPAQRRPETAAGTGRGRELFVLVAEVGAHDSCLQIFKRAKVFDNIAAGVVEKKLAVLGAADGDDPLEIVPVFKEIVDGLGDARPGIIVIFGRATFSFSCLGMCLIYPLAGRYRNGLT